MGTADRLSSAPLRLVIVRDVQAIASMRTQKLPDGALVLVQSLGNSVFELVRLGILGGSPLVPDNLNVVAASGGGLWVRIPQRGTLTLVNGSATVNNVYIASVGQTPGNARIAVSRTSQPGGTPGTQTVISKSPSSFFVSTTSGDDGGIFDWLVYRADS